MSAPAESSTENLEQSVLLYRKLLSLLQTPGSEGEMSRFVVDRLFEEFPDFRVSYTTLKPDGWFRINYSRQPDGLRCFSGVEARLPPSPIVDELWLMRISVIEDVQAKPHALELARDMGEIFGSLARVDIPVDRSEAGELTLLTLSHAQPRQWDPRTIQLIRDVAELVRLMLREARYRDQLRRAENLFREFAQTMPVVFWVSEASGENAKDKMTFVSQAYEQIWGLSTRSLLENPASFIEAIHPEDRDRVRKAVANQLRGSYQEIYRVIRPDGSVRWIKDRGVPIKNEAGEATRVLGIAEDITALHETREKLLVTQAQVITNAKFAALGEMAGGIAHEINNPLAVISALAQQMREVSAEGEVSSEFLLDGLGTIEKMCLNMANIVKGLRTFSRQSDQDPLISADLREILRETLVLCEAKVKKATRHFRILVPEIPLLMRCRPAEISQVILNLVNNALDAVDGREEKAISLRLETKGPMIELSVEDSGPGVKPELREQIFHPFFTTKEVGKGTGLGLSISKGIVEAHGGKLFLADGPGPTRFVVQLPREIK